MIQLKRVSGAIIGLALAIALAGIGVVGARAPGAKGPSSPAGSQSTEANITRMTSILLAQSQFTNRPLDGDFGGKLLSRYLDALDGARSLFFQTDVAEFERYRETLAEATRERGDTAAAHAIFARYLERLAQLADHTEEGLGRASFDFTGNDVYTFDREKARRPAHLAAARELWWRQLRAEYLQEKLAEKRSGREIVATLKRRQNQRLLLM